MGLFSSKRKTFVETSVIRVVEDEQLPNTRLQALVRAIFNNSDIPLTFVDTMLNAPFRNFERMYRYAERGDYFYGLPNVRVMSSSDGAEQVKTVIEGIENAPVEIEYSYFRPLNHTHAGWKSLNETYAFNESTNEITGLSAVKGYPVYLERMVAVYQLGSGAGPETNTLGTWSQSSQAGQIPGRPVGNPEYNLQSLVMGEDARYGDNETDSVELHCIWEVPAVYDENTGELVTEAVIHREIITVDLTDYDSDKEYFQAKYKTNINGIPKIHYWVYQPEDGLYPSLDNVFAHNYTNPGTFFPFAIFRREKQNRATSALENTEEYQSTKKLLNYIGIDFQDFSDSVHENPDIEDIEQAVLMMAVPITTEHPLEMEYLFSFFSNAHSLMSSQKPVTFYSDYVRGQMRKKPDDSYAIEIADADFRVILSFDGLTKGFTTATIGEPGTYLNEIFDTQDVVDLPFGLDVPGISTRVTRRIRRQVTATVCEDIYIINPTLRYDIYQGKSVIGAADDERTLIPLDYSLCKSMKALDREELYFRSLHFVANSRVTVKVKWYESGWFKTILLVVAVVVTIMVGIEAFSTVYASFQAGGALVALVELLFISIEILAITAALKMTFSLIVNAIGVEAAIYLAVAFAVYGGYRSFQAGGLGQDVWAERLLQASNGLTDAAGGVLKELFADYQLELQEFQSMKEEALEELQKAQDLLGTQGLLDPLSFTGLQPMVIHGETPDNYYNRTVHSGNVGVLSYEIIENFVDISLRLPTIQDTLGDTFYV